MTNFKYTHFNGIVEMWNSIPLDIRLSPSLAVFKSGMKTVFNVFIFDLIFFWLLLHIYLFRLATWWSVSHGDTILQIILMALFVCTFIFICH